MMQLNSSLDLASVNDRQSTFVPGTANLPGRNEGDMGILQTRTSPSFSTGSGTRFSSRSLKSLSTLVGLALFCASARADNLYLIEHGKTADGSNFNGTAIAAGTNFEFILTFDAPTVPDATINYAVETIKDFSIDVGGSIYHPDNIGDLGVLVLIDSRAGIYGSSNITWITGLDWSPRWYGANPVFFAGAPAPTVFSSYGPATASSLSFATSNAGEMLSIVTDPDATYSARISDTPNPVPEPSSFALLGLGGVGVAIRTLRRRRTATFS